MNKELVYHPTHYSKEGRKECWEEMIEIFGADAVVIFDCLSAYKYDYRAGEKEGNPADQDKEKIKNYLNHVNKLIGEYNLKDDTFDVIRRIEDRL